MGKPRPNAPHYPVPSAPGCGPKPRARNRSFGGGRATEAHGLVGLGSFSRKRPGGAGAGEGAPLPAARPSGPGPVGRGTGRGLRRRRGGAGGRGAGSRGAVGAARPRRGGEERDPEPPSARLTWRVGSEPSLCVRAARAPSLPCPARARPGPEAEPAPRTTGPGAHGAPGCVRLRLAGSHPGGRRGAGPS